MNHMDGTAGGVAAFFSHLNKLLDRSERLFVQRAEQAPLRRAVYKAATLPIAGVREPLAKLAAAAEGDPAVMRPLAAVLAETGGAELMGAMLAAEPAPAGGQGGPGVSDVTDIGSDILGKAAGYLPPPFDKAAENIGQVLGIIGKLAGDEKDTNELIEQLQKALEEVAREVDKIEQKAERIGELVGHPVIKDGTVVSGPSEDGFNPSQIPGSLLWMVWQNQFKLEHVFRQVLGKDYPGTQGGGWVVPPPPADGLTGGDAWLRDNGGQLGRICYKIDKLAELLGKALVHHDAEWDPEPPIHNRTVTANHNRLPEKSVKEELHELEDMIARLRQVLIVIFDVDIFIDVDVDIWTLIVKVFNRIANDTALKRIFVADEGVFEPTSVNDVKVIPIRGRAFDLAGWVDLDDLRVGDRVRVELFVHLPAAGGTTRRRFYAGTTYIGRGAPGLPIQLAARSATGRGVKSLQDICGPSTIVGRAVDIEIQQTRSADGFTTRLPIAWQLVVESRDDPPPGS